MDSSAGGSSDERLMVERSLAEPDVFVDLFDRYAPGVHRYALLRVGEGLVDEVVVRTFLRAFRRRRSFASRGLSFRAWIYRMVGRVIATYRRVAAGRCRVVDGGWAIPVLRTMRRRERDAFLLVAWAGLPPPEAAQALGLAPERLQACLDRALGHTARRI